VETGEEESCWGLGADPNALNFQRLKNALEFGKGGVT